MKSERIQLGSLEYDVRVSYDPNTGKLRVSVQDKITGEGGSLYYDNPLRYTQPSFAGTLHLPVYLDVISP